MSKIEFPLPLKNLLEDSDLQAPLRMFADRVGEILTDNKLVFFPDYTDHGIDHVNCVLKSEVDLIPKTVWDDSKNDSGPRLLCDADAAVIIGATLLHDIAMHLTPSGFLELVSSSSRFKPLQWCRESHEGHAADRPWQELWEEYLREARRFSDRDLVNIIGEGSARDWKFQQLPEDTGQWERNHYLIIGEFIRRHHARLAHEIAMYGFPGVSTGLGEGSFPAMGKEEGHPMMRLADLIGLTARSHGMSLRVCKAYLENLYPGTPRPMGTAVLYPMALLRVADYLQIDQQRAPAVLLQLRNPQSPISVLEWQKHKAVQNIGPANDPRGKMVTVDADLTLPVYLQLQELLKGLQAEMDHSTAVLDETYGARADLGLNKLNLAIRRVHSNLESPAFRGSLPYVPDRTGFTADPNILTLLVEPLYGKEPSVGVRELMQNAVDAVCELEAWCAVHGKAVESLNLPEQDGDVLIEFVQRYDGSWFLRVRDRGMGMTSDTIQSYFLRAGASFRRSAEWAKEFLDEHGSPRVSRAGRFGVGAFAVFLLGSTFRLETRHAGADSSKGYNVEASANSQLIEIRRVDNLPVGTTIEVDLSRESVTSFDLESDRTSRLFGLYWPTRKVDWYCWDWPVVTKRIVSNIKTEVLDQQYICPVRKSALPSHWADIYPSGFDAVYWTFGDAPRLSCNGLKIEYPSSHWKNWHKEIEFVWPEETQLYPPCIAVVDSAANLPLTIQRYELSQKRLPFIAEVARDVILSFIANALVCGPMSPSEAIYKQYAYPLKPNSYTKYESDTLLLSGDLLSWSITARDVVPADPWLYSLLKTESCFVYGVIYVKDPILSGRVINGVLNAFVQATDSAVYCEQCEISNTEDEKEFLEEDVSLLIARGLADFVNEGITNLGHEVDEYHIVVSSSREYDIKCSWMPITQRSDEEAVKIWEKIPSSTAKRHWLEARSDSYVCTSLATVLKDIEDAFQNYNKQAHQRHTLKVPEIIYVAEIKTNKVDHAPESMLARIWNECLGARAIPFDPVAREAMIADGCRHPELKRHIEAWQEMKRSGSKWVTGEV